MTYQYATKSGSVKSFEAASDAAAEAMVRSFSDADPRSGVMKSSSATPVASQQTPVAGPPTQAAIAAALAQNPDYQRYAGSNDPAAILSAYETGNWSGVTDLTGKPFTNEQQAAAVKQAEKALAPAYEAQLAYDQAGTIDSLESDVKDYGQFQRDEAIGFQAGKDALDQSAADSGVLFSGARLQKQNDLRTAYQNRGSDARGRLEDSITNTARTNQYQYGDDAARKLRSYYEVPGSQSFNPTRATGGVRSSPGLSSVYDSSQYKFQGTKPVAQKAAVQTRAASLLANKANKLSLSGVGAKF